MSNLSQFFGGGRIKSIQRGEASVPPGTGQTPITISPVDPDKTVVYHLGARCNGSRALDAAITLTLLDGSTFVANRNAGDATTTVSYQVVEFE